MTPRSPEQNRALRDATRSRVLDSALRLFSRLGYQAASIRRIARDADVAQGLLYSHFRGKEDLLRALFRLSMEDVRSSFAAAAEPDGRPPLERLIRSAFATLRGKLAFWRLTYGVRMQEPVMRALGPDLKAWTGEILGFLEAHFRAAGARQPALEAAMLFAAIDGISQHYALDPRHYPLEAVEAALVARYAPAAPPLPKTGGRHVRHRRT